MRLSLAICLMALLTPTLARAQSSGATTERERNRANGAIAPSVVLGGFAHVNAGYERVALSTDEVSQSLGFQVGGLDLILDGQVDEDFRFLGEVLFEYGPGGVGVLDVERLLGIWSLKPWFVLQVGRDHTRLGFWNEHFHHGTWLQTSIHRPLVYHFEDDGGLLPAHDVGAKVSGELVSDAGVVLYNVSVANGRGPITDFIQLSGDLDLAKQFSAKVSFSPAFAPDSGVGVLALTDVIADDPNNASRPSLREHIGGVHLFYVIEPVEFLAEGFGILHADVNSSDTWANFGGYVLASYRIGAVKPYYLFDVTVLDPDDPYYLDAVSQTRHTAGVRWDARTFVALKIQGEVGISDARTRIGFGTQLAWTF